MKWLKEPVQIPRWHFILYATLVTISAINVLVWAVTQ